MMSCLARRMWLLAVVAFVLCVVGVDAQSSLPVVPGGGGFGMNTRAAYACGTNPAIQRVSNLNDSGAGSLRAALTASGPRVVIFEISGTITLTSDINITAPCITIAGQTAPSPGITLRGAMNASESAGGLNIWTHDVLVQHLRIRPGDGGPFMLSTAAHNGILIGYFGDTYNVVIDHCSLSWAAGKQIQVARPNNASITLWRNIFSEALYRASNVTDDWAAGQPSSYGMHLVPDFTHAGYSVIGNLLAHNAVRNPETGSGVALHWINNVVYDWGKDSNPYQWATFFYGIDPGTWKANIIGNKYIAGPGPYPAAPLYAVGVWAANAGSQLYLSDNAIDQTRGTVVNYINYASTDPRVSTPPVSMTGITAMSASSIESFVLANAGARPTDRDSVDSRIVNEVKNRTGNVISSQNTVGGWPTLAVNTRALTVPTNPHTVTSSGYTNLEIWIQGYAATVEGTTPPPQTQSPPNPPTGVRIVS